MCLAPLTRFQGDAKLQVQQVTSIGCRRYCYSSGQFETHSLLTLSQRFQRPECIKCCDSMVRQQICRQVPAIYVIQANAVRLRAVHVLQAGKSREFISEHSSDEIGCQSSVLSNARPVFVSENLQSQSNTVCKIRVCEAHALASCYAEHDLCYGCVTD